MLNKRMYSDEEIFKKGTRRRDFKLGKDNRGTFKKRKLEPVDKEIAHFIRMQGCISTSESYKVALHFASSGADSPEKIMVLFVMLVHNYSYYPGFRLNSN